MLLLRLSHFRWYKCTCSVLIKKKLCKLTPCYFKYSSSMAAKVKSSYEEAVYALNGLQSNRETIKKAHNEKDAKAHLNLSLTEKYLENLGIQVHDLDSLNVIHVAGTKGKGSTCAFSEAIIRKHGYKTGFYSSPHLVSVNERIRINGQPVSKELFSKYFWEIYSHIQQNLKPGEVMPSYFLFLTVMAYYVFMKEKVEAAIMEVGIGGLWDCTNIIRKPVAVGITALGIDHVDILGESISAIAEQKAGIFKPSVPAFTVPQQEAAMKVLRLKAKEKKCPLLLSPPLEAYEEKIYFGDQGVVQNMNASLALQLTNTWLKRKQSAHQQQVPHTQVNGILEDVESLYVPLQMSNTFCIDLKTKQALENCRWPGRYHVINKGKVTFYLDGAHTQQSMKYCARWFEDLSTRQASSYKGPILRVLLFNCTGERKAESLLAPLSDLHFDLVIFSPNRIHVMKDATSDLSNFMVDDSKEMEQVSVNREIWSHIQHSIIENELSVSSVNSLSSTTKLEASALCDNSLQFSSLTDVLTFICSEETNKVEGNVHASNLLKNANHVQVLVAGSLHLIGGVLSLIGF